MKFTEEQFKQLVEIQVKYFPITMLENGVGGTSPYDAIRETNIKLIDFIWNETLRNEAVALMNPLTREWAHDKFVEKEKRYFWSTKKKSKKGKPMTLFNSAGGIAQMTGPKHALTESEIREWGYDPEMFDREEVE